MILNTYLTQLKIEVDKNYFSHNYEGNSEFLGDIDHRNIDRIYSDFIRKYNFLSDAQLLNLNKFFETIHYIVPLIHPDKIEMNECIHEEVDLMFWKESKKGFSEIILHDDGDVSCYFISKISSDKKKSLYELDNVDFESILFNFLSK